MNFRRQPPFLILRPKPGTWPSRQIAPESGIVGQEQGEQLLVYYEGNLYNSSNLRSLEERITHAAGRMAENYPTVAFGLFLKEDFEVIGTIAYDDGWIIRFDAEPGN